MITEFPEAFAVAFASGFGAMFLVGVWCALVGRIAGWFRKLMRVHS
jgi:hypothetical protein